MHGLMDAISQNARGFKERAHGHLEFGPAEEIKCQLLIQRRRRKSGRSVECFSYFQIQMSQRLSPFTAAAQKRARDMSFHPFSKQVILKSTSSRTINII